MCAQTGDYKYVHTSVIPLTDNSAAKLIRQCPNGDDVTGGRRRELRDGPRIKGRRDRPDDRERRDAVLPGEAQRRQAAEDPQEPRVRQRPHQLRSGPDHAQHGPEDPLPVSRGSFRATVEREDESQHASIKYTGRFNHAGISAHGTYREHGNLVNQRLHTHLTHCNTGTVSWSATASD